MKKRTTAAIMLTTVAVLLAVAPLIASNMGYKIVYRPDVGRNSLSLPYIPKSILTDAGALLDHIEEQTGPNIVSSVSRFDTATNGLVTYTGSAGTNFSLQPGEGYVVALEAATEYRIVGSHDPGRMLTLSQGTTLIALPYHIVATNAAELIEDIQDQAGPGTVESVSRYDTTSGALITYTGSAGTNFDLTMGEAYHVSVVPTSIDYVPTHY